MLLKGSHRSDRKEKNKWILMSFAGVKAIIHMYEESPEYMTVNLIFKCQKCSQVATIRTTRELLRSMIERW